MAFSGISSLFIRHCAVWRCSFKRHISPIRFGLFSFQNTLPENTCNCVTTVIQPLSVFCQTVFRSKACCNLSSSHQKTLIIRLSHYNSFPTPFTLLCVPSVVYCFGLKSVSSFLLQHYLLPLLHIPLSFVKPISSMNYSCLALLDCHLSSSIYIRSSLDLLQGCLHLRF